jgi:hypothetical protein
MTYDDERVDQMRKRVARTAPTKRSQGDLFCPFRLLKCRRQARDRSPRVVWDMWQPSALQHGQCPSTHY